ncbi:MAG: hypothetical protein QW797_07480 [Thermoproteota archaeon]
MLLELLTLVSGIFILAYCSEHGVSHAASFATTAGIPRIVVGVVIVSIGTDLPELVNSIFSSAMGHGDINVGDSLGSCLGQISLILGLVGIVSGGFKVDREEVLELGRSELMGLLLAIFISKSGFISRVDALLLIGGYVLLIIASRHYLLKNYKEQNFASGKAFKHLLMFFIYLAGVGVGSYMVVNAAILLSSELHVLEYLISFFVLAIGTSLPELVVDITAARKKEYAIALGDIIGSNIVDSTLSIAAGPLIAPISFNGSLAFITGLWAFLVSLIVLLILGLKREMSPRMGVFFIILYLLSYSLLFID